MEDNKARYGFVSKNKVYLIRCPKCKFENWGLAVSSGRCAWCGYVAKIEDVEEKDYSNDC